MQFASFVFDEAVAACGANKDVRAQFEPVVTIDQKALLVDNLAYITSSLSEKRPAPLKLSVYNLSEADVPGPDNKKSAANPGKPTLALF
jgi:hypothetical protein